MKIRLAVLLLTLAISLSAHAQSAPATIDTSKLGPQVGAAVPPFAGVDQFGKSHTLESIYGPKGTMLVFFRSADW
jgi:cytochrome oxidase Cu insertion factor (SCO1/SenC/PrrC family)